MTFETAFNNLSEKIGDDFNWVLLSDENTSFINEAKKEIGKEHSLYEYTLYPKAKCDSNDDVLYEIDNGKYVIIHLTYSTSNSLPYPKYTMFDNAEKAVAYIEKAFYEEFL